MNLWHELKVGVDPPEWVYVGWEDAASARECIERSAELYRQKFMKGRHI